MNDEGFAVITIRHVGARVEVMHPFPLRTRFSTQLLQHADPAILLVGEGTARITADNARAEYHLTVCEDDRFVDGLLVWDEYDPPAPLPPLTSEAYR